MKLKSLFILLFVLNVTFLFVVGIVISNYQKATVELEDAYELQYKSLLLAQELRQSSDDLTRMARTYVITGNPMFEEQFNMVLDIRNGVISRPVRYHGIFWDFLTLQGAKPKLDGQTISLRELMKQSNFTQDELNMLLSSQNESDYLTNLETKAMYAVKGIFQDKNGEYTIKGEPNFKLAREIMHSDEYHEAKIKIMKPLDEFYRSFEKRTKKRVTQAKTYVKKLEFYVNVAVLFSTIMLVVSFFVILFRIIYSIQSLRNIMTDLSNNNTDVEIPKTLYDDEISDMLKSVEVFKENTKTLITREHQLEVAVNEAKSANHAKSAFLARMSHELRTPLNAILGFTSIINKSTNINNKEKENLNIIFKSANYLLSLINEILELSKIEARKIEIKKVDFSLDNMINEVKSIIAQRASSKACEFIINKSSDLPNFIRTDEQRLKQILINLLSNSVKFSNKGLIRLEIYSRMNKLFFEVHDTGIGIDKKNLELIFKPFEQIETKNYNKNGTGLGLSITKELVTLLGGSIYVKSKVGDGSSFYFSVEFENSNKELEINENLKKEVDEIYNITSRNYDYKILVVDDILENREYLSQLFEYYGFKTIKAKDGFDAIEKFENEKVDLIIMDTLMPNLNGFEAIKQIRKKDLNIPIITISANVFEEDKKESLKVGANGFLEKPVDEKKLFSLIGKFLDVKYTKETIKEDTQTKYISLNIDTKKNIIQAVNEMDDYKLEVVIKQIDEKLKNEILRLKDEFKYHEILNLIEKI